MEKASGKIGYLDGIRGTASVLVFFHHFLLTFYSAYFTFDTHASHLNNLEVMYGQSIFSVFSNGHFCVCVFFVLSGFVLSMKYFQTNKLEVLVSGAYRRFLRLYIPVSATMAISFILLMAGAYHNVAASAITGSEWFRTLWDIPHPLSRLWVCLRTSTMFQGDNIFDTSLWTMSIEFAGSMMVFAFLALTHNSRNLLLSLIILLLFCKVTYNRPMGAFVLGVSLNYVTQLVPLFSKPLIKVATVLLLMVGLILGSFPTTFNITGTIFGYFPRLFMIGREWVHIVGAWFLVLAFVLSSTLQRIAGSRPLRFLGYISFSLYLLHPLVIGSFSSYLLLRMYPMFGYNLSVVYIFLLTLTVCLPLSWLMAKYVDGPGTRFSRYVYERWFRKEK